MTHKNKDEERSIETFFGAFGEDSDEWEDIEKRLYAKRLVSLENYCVFDHFFF